jgi:uncharacterized protein
MKEVLIKATHGGRIEVPKGQFIEIINVEGQQVCDFWAFNGNDLDEVLSPAHMRSQLRRFVLKVGDVLASRYRNPMLELVEDTCGRNDFVIPPCDPGTYLQRYGLRDHRSCAGNLAEAMAGKKIPPAYLLDPINLFQNTPIGPDGSIGRGLSLAKPGDKVVMRALVDVIAAGSACPMLGGSNGDRIKDIRFVVHD